MNTIGDRIKYLRESNKLTSEQLGKIANVSKGAISQWENNAVEPKAKALINMANYFNVSVDFIVLGTIENERQINMLNRKIQSLINKKKLTTNQIKLIDDQLLFIENMIDSWVKPSSDLLSPTEIDTQKPA